MNINKLVKCLFCIGCMSASSLFSTTTSHATRIIAIVGDEAITDTDLNSFSDILCLMMHKNVNCNKEEIMQISAITLVETTLKSIYFKNLELQKMLDNNYNTYKNNVYKSIGQHKLSKINKEQFDWYLQTEYLWMSLIASQNRETKITENDIQNYATTHNIALSDKNKAQIENMIMQSKIEEKSKKTIEELKKFYLVEIR